jgi:hypothetical protein
VSAFPDVAEFQVDDGLEMIVMASDGVWEMKQSDEVIEFIRSRLLEGSDLSLACRQLLDSCLSEGRVIPLLFNSFSALREWRQGHRQHDHDSPALQETWR